MTHEHAQPEPALNDPAQPEAEAVPSEHQHAPVEVKLERSVRYSRLLIVGAVLGGLISAIVALALPVIEQGNYTMAQAVGVATVFGAVIGLAIGGAVGLLLGLVAKRKRGGAVAIQTDVR